MIRFFTPFACGHLIAAGFIEGDALHLFCGALLLVVMFAASEQSHA